jgi:hypothetical protein
VPGDGDPLEVEGAEQAEQVTLVSDVGIRVAVRAQPVPFEIEGDDP